MPSIHGLGLSFSALTVTYNAGAVDDSRVDAGSEAFTAPAATEFRRSLLVVDAAGAVTEVAGADTSDQLLASAVYPAIPAGETVLCGVELDSSAITDILLTIAGDMTPASS